jgi:hypothetical protein
MRNDVHSPASPDFDPSSYEFVACGDNGNGEERPYHATVELRDLRAQGILPFEGADRQHCTHCGAFLRFYAVMVHFPTNEYIFIGETCLDNRFDQGLSAEQFQQLRTEAKLNRERIAKASKIEALIEANPFLTEVIEFANDFDYFHPQHNEFISSIAAQIESKGELSERQLSSVQRALAGAKKFQAAKVAQEAAKAAQIAAGALSPVPVGKTAVVGQIASEPVWKENGFGGALKVRVVADQGFALWMTVPAKLGEVTKGERISFVATLTPSDDDKYFGFASRPSQAKRV